MANIQSTSLVFHITTFLVIPTCGNNPSWLNGESSSITYLFIYLFIYILINLAVLHLIRVFEASSILVAAHGI